MWSFYEDGKSRGDLGKTNKVLPFFNSNVKEKCVFEKVIKFGYVNVILYGLSRCFKVIVRCGDPKSLVTKVGGRGYKKGYQEYVVTVPDKLEDGA